jgi:hypothetical protein
MSQRSVERVLGRLITDSRFRSDFFEEPDRACADEGVELSSVEMQALLRIDENVLLAFAAGVDPRIWRDTSPGEDA